MLAPLDSSFITVVAISLTPSKTVQAYSPPLKCVTQIRRYVLPAHIDAAKSTLEMVEKRFTADTTI